MLSNARDFLNPKKKQDGSRISIELEEGSVIIKFLVASSIAIQSQALLNELNKSHDLGLLEPKQAEAIQQIQHFISKENFVLKFGSPHKLEEGLFLNRQTEWQYPEEVWIDEELYITGEIVDVGGKTNPNVHLDTEEFGTITISSNREMLGDDTKNRLYKKQQVRIQIKRNLNTGEYNKKSATLLEYVDIDESENPDDYLDRLITESTPYWEKIGDSEEWLKTIRAYEG